MFPEVYGVQVTNSSSHEPELTAIAELERMGFNAAGAATVTSFKRMVTSWSS